MSDDLGDPREWTVDTLKKAVARNDARLKRATLPDRRLKVGAAEASELVAAFRRVRDGHRGRYVAPTADLPAKPTRVATAIDVAAATAPDAERRRLMEDLVDLQSFIDDPPSSLAPPPAGLAPDPGDPSLALLESLRWRQAGTIASAMGHATVTGDHMAMRRRWTAIGDARAAINLAVEYREAQAGGLFGLLLWVVAAPVGGLAALVFGGARFSLVAAGLLVAGWFGASWLGATVGAIGARLSRIPLRARWPGLVGAFSFAVTAAGLILIPAAIGFLAFVLATRLGLR